MHESTEIPFHAHHFPFDEDLLLHGSMLVRARVLNCCMVMNDAAGLLILQLFFTDYTRTCAYTRTGAVLLHSGGAAGLFSRQLVLLDPPDAALGAAVQARPLHPSQVRSHRKSKCNTIK